jgi:hypothetical protein
MVEEKDTAWRELLHKHGLIQEAYILGKYGSGSATDVSKLKKDIFRQSKFKCTNFFFNLALLFKAKG